MPELDGTAKHHEFITPFDAHDRVLRQTDRPPTYEYQEYPKAVAHDANGEPVLAYNAEHEIELTGGEE